MEYRWHVFCWVQCMFQNKCRRSCCLNPFRPQTCYLSFKKSMTSMWYMLTTPFIWHTYDLQRKTPVHTVWRTSWFWRSQHCIGVHYVTGFFMSRVLLFLSQCDSRTSAPFPLEADLKKSSTMQYETFYHGVQVLTA